MPHARNQARKRAGVVRVEGIKMIETCLAFGWTPDIVLCGTREADELERMERLAGHELQLASDDVVKSVMSQPRLELAVAFGPPPSAPSSLPRRPQRALLLAVQDPNNLGSLLRSGLAMGVDTVFLLPGTPDPFNAAVLRASAGAAMGLRYGDEAAALACGLPVIAAVAHGGKDATGLTQGPGHFLLALGHETRGLPDEWLARGRCVSLDCDFESLGVAVAGAVILDRLRGR